MQKTQDDLTAVMIIIKIIRKNKGFTFIALHALDTGLLC